MLQHRRMLRNRKWRFWVPQFFLWRKSIYRQFNVFRCYCRGICDIKELDLPIKENRQRKFIQIHKFLYKINSSPSIRRKNEECIKCSFFFAAVCLENVLHIFRRTLSLYFFIFANESFETGASSSICSHWILMEKSMEWNSVNTMYVCLSVLPSSSQSPL